MATSTLEPCSLHKSHSPKNETTEWHHIIPVAWQLKTAVASPPFPGNDTDGRGMLWDNRGIWICPTSHRNVHYWIVEMMHEAVAIGSDDVPTIIKAVEVKHKLRHLASEFPIAVDALVRYIQETSASLLALAAEGEWGQI